MPKTIVITVPTYYPLQDGVQNITQFYAEYLAEYYNVIVITEIRDDLLEEEEHNNVRILRVKTNCNRLKDGFISKDDMKMICDEYSRADVILNVCLQTTLTDISMRIVEQYKAYKILYIHGMAQFSFPNVPKITKHDILRFIYNNTYWRFYYIRNMKWLKQYDLCVHLHEKDPSYRYFQKLCMKNIVLENGVLWKKKNTKKIVDRPYFLCVSRFSDAKNQRFIIDAYLQSNTSMDLVFIGNKKNDYYSYLCNYEKKQRSVVMDSGNQKRIVYYTDLPRDTTEKYIINCYAILNGSKTEKYPVVICEAMKAGVPYITTDVGIVKYLPGGFVVKNEKEMSDYIGVLSNNASVYSQLATSGKQYAEESQSMNHNAIKLKHIISEGVIE